MEPQCVSKGEPGPHSSVLRLLTSPLRLICATVLRVVQERDVLNYGILEEFVTLISEIIPDLLHQRQWAQLILGLRAKVVLELCRSESSADSETIQHHLDRIRRPTESSIRDADMEAFQSNFLAFVKILQSDPVKRDHFFQEVFPVEYGLKYDLALQRLISIFVSRLEEFLPISRIDKVAAMLSMAPSVMEECFQTLSHPKELLNSLSHLKNHSYIKTTDEDHTYASSLPQPPEEDDCIFSCLSHPPIVQVGMDIEHKACEVELESSDCEEVSIECEEVSSSAAEVNIEDGTLETERREELVRTADCRLGSVYRHIGHQQQQICGDTQDDSSKAVATPAEEPKELLRSGDNLKNSICQQRQLVVKLHRIDLTGKSLPLHLTRPKRTVRKRRLSLLWTKRKGPEIAWMVSDDEPDPNPKSRRSVAKTDRTGSRPPAVVFACSKCSFRGSSGVTLDQHIMKKHPDDFNRLHSTGFRQGSVAKLQGRRVACASVQQVQLPKRIVMSDKCPVCSKPYAHCAYTKRHLHFCSGCGKCFQDNDSLKKHTEVCKLILPPQEDQGPLSDENNKPKTTSNNDKNTRELQSFNKDCKSAAPVGESSTEHTGSETVDPKVCSRVRDTATSDHTQEGYMGSHSTEKPCKELHLPEKESNKHPSDSFQNLTQGDVLSKICSICGKVFTRASTRRDHEKRQHGVRSECANVTQGDINSKVCSTCGKTFTRASSRREHEKRQHEKSSECSNLTQSDKHPHDSCHDKKAVKLGLDTNLTQGDVHSKVCPTCGKTFTRATDRRKHQKRHTSLHKPSKWKHKCAKCDEVFRTRCDLGKHQRCHWGDDPLRCAQCGRRFRHSVQLASHKQIHSQCTMCDKTFNDITSLCSHYLQAHNIKDSYPCPHCKKTYTEVCRLVQHLTTHTGERPYQCLQCHKRFLTAARLFSHTKTHVGAFGDSTPRERPHQCHVCGKCFYTANGLKVHEMTHQSARECLCSVCGKSFKDVRAVKTHMACHMDSQERPRYPCSYCGKTFIRAATLVRHNRIHTGERPFPCSECNKTFLTQSEVFQHMRYHTGERPFKCKVCSKSFTQSCFLTTHMRKHTGERPYACSVCDKRFSMSVHMKRHMLIHTGEKPFACERCGKAYNQRGLLNKHRKKCS